ncbi:sulfurtransferase [Pseudomonas sp. Eqa60]|jgi:thiosulfate/3-mercaptopyruvate sulfurtransferase|uniref:Putative 3-mercaptopyruvate sulfurtransferase SseA n=1 Tax=Pseudomonas protegens (strain DSM 19095 / LMG 27888 / CFBP 6595 / CHA0) TaxID=1124983 RepID=A0A2C9EV56_PSEPH|nr:MULTISPECIES: sulfurtransferase [Pseudomonas]AGL87545.1 putative 3-mercaptopyruvate sulfurtransferase SseA [Pseudomonas protegens CHA0]MBP5095979.1 sulfurtransferase [Pseudomonas protegens]MBP5105079.1 sulfurtransferase [Pseudomonas protegens]MBP5109605.1 sulfurtransferase [Pseudomonas protegens]MBP5128657.1 sulfurtransferase [Pseudomonas protegens]
MPLAQLISPLALDQKKQQPGLVILDCRFALEDPDYGQRSYADGHIAGAHFADLNRDLSAPVIKGVTGRHPLPEPAQLVARLQAWGIDNDSEIVLYDDGPGSYAARAWWLLAWLGKRDGVFILDGGLKAWHAAGLPLSLDAPENAPGQFVGHPDHSLLLDAEHLGKRLGQTDLTLLDARGLPRFRGEVEPIDPVAGHIPGAQCAAFTDNLGEDGRFLPADQLKQRFAQKLAGRDPQQLVAYCGSGVTACHNLFALSLAGYPLGRLYAGSWSEWITDAQRPVATGD